MPPSLAVGARGAGIARRLRLRLPTKFSSGRPIPIKLLVQMSKDQAPPPDRVMEVSRVGDLKKYIILVDR